MFVWNLVLFQKHIDILIGVSEYANKEIVYAFRVPPEKVRTIYTYLDSIYTVPLKAEVVRQVLATYGLPKQNYFIYIGRFRTHKNVDNLVAAYLLYREQNPHATELLVLCGGSREEYEKTFGHLPPLLSRKKYVSSAIFQRNICQSYMLVRERLHSLP